jgi:glycosyltransferase involved in cell wall biosynthesis
MVGIEAGCVGLPAVGFATGGIPEWLVSGTTGESSPCDPPTAAGLADAIVRALRDPEHYHLLQVGAWQMAQEFSQDRHLSVLESTLAEAARE